MPQVEVILPTTQAQTVRPTRIAAYCRVSSDSEDQMNSFYAQVRHYTTTIDELPNSVLVDIYADEGISGSTMEKREDFKRMLADCNKGKIDRILTKSVSRFARNTLECLETIRDLKLKGVSVYFEEQKIDTLKMGDELLITMFGSVAQSEARSISKNIKLMNRKRMAAGEFVTRSAPYGYRYQDRSFIPQPEEAEVVRRVFADFLSGDGLATIANKLNDEDVPTNGQGKRWYANTIDIMLRNEKYIGDICHQKTYHADDLPFTKRKNRGELPQYYVQGTHEPIIEREMFNKAQELLKRKERPARIRNTDASPFDHLITCASCGTVFRRRLIGGKAYWICGKATLRKEYCDMPQVPESELEAAFVAMFNKLREGSKLILSPAISTLTELRDMTQKENDQLTAVDKRLVELNDKKLLLTKLRTRGIMQEQDYLTELTGIDQELDKLRRERKKVLAGDESLDQITQLKRLQTMLVESEVLTAFDGGSVTDIVDGIVVESRTQITFQLPGGLRLNAKIGEAME